MLIIYYATKMNKNSIKRANELRSLYQKMGDTRWSTEAEARVIEMAQVPVLGRREVWVEEKLAEAIRST